jgi:hypothetical protein
LIVEGKENFDLYSLKEKMEQGLVHTTFKNFDFNGGFSYEKGQMVNKGVNGHFKMSFFGHACRFRECRCLNNTTRYYLIRNWDMIFSERAVVLLV